MLLFAKKQRQQRRANVALSSFAISRLKRQRERERGRERSGKERKTNLVDGAPLWVPFVNFRFVIGVALERSGLPLLHSLRAKRGRRRGHSRRERGGHAEYHFVACGAVFVCAGCRREFSWNRSNEKRKTRKSTSVGVDDSLPPPLKQNKITRIEHVSRPRFFLFSLLCSTKITNVCDFEFFCCVYLNETFPPPPFSLFFFFLSFAPTKEGSR